MATVLALLLVSGTAGIVAAEGLSAVTPPDSGDAVPADGPAYGVKQQHLPATLVGRRRQR